SYEAILRDHIQQPNEKQKAYDIPESESHQQETNAPQSKWDAIASDKSSDSKLISSAKILIISAIAIAIVVASGIFSFFLLKSKPQPPQGTQTTGTSPAVRTAKPDPKAEENARRLAALEKKLADADAYRKQSKFDDALKTYQSLLGEGWKEKEAVILFGAAECHENMSQDDEAVSYYVKCIDAGWKDNAQPYVRISKLLNKKANCSDSIRYLEKARETFPSDTSIGAQLAESYYLAGQTDKAVAELKKADKSDLSLDMIRLFGSVLTRLRTRLT
ncbi:MAG: tetratricopeptide repeat protein, partial [Lentisphaerae bacterium]|nr:tetratricopeptide repeat protein [Lentisphaerota bacterium]